MHLAIAVYDMVVPFEFTCSDSVGRDLLNGVHALSLTYTTPELENIG